ncbi:MAG: hypothetical protein ACRDF4_00510 [Rhabdochlamydiaceae bacterium]
MKIPEATSGTQTGDGFDDLFAYVKAELNFLRLPYFATCKSAQSRFLELIEIVERDGFKKKIEWRVVPDPRLGLPGAIERNVMMWILKRIDEARPSPNAPVPIWLDIGSLYAISTELGIQPGGEALARIRKAIKKLGATNCISQGAFYNKATQSYVESGEVFTFLAGWRFKGAVYDGKVWEVNEVSIHPLIRQNLDVFYVKTLDWYLLRSLEIEIAALLYPHLSCVFHGLRRDQEYVELAYSWLAQRLGIKVWDDLREAKKQLKYAHQELLNKGYLSNVKWVGNKIQYFPGLRANAETSRQRQRKRAVPPKRAQQLVIPTLEKVKEIVDLRANEIAYQTTKLKMGRSLNLERLAQLDITPEEVYAALGTNQDAPGTST